jgi:hypothetical protein
VKKSKQWSVCLPIGGALKAAEAPDADLTWLATRGIEGEALNVLRLLRRQVLPHVRWLERQQGLVSYHFLVHDRTSGVPCPPEDTTAYIQLRCWFKRPVDGTRLFSAPWCYLRALDEKPEMAKIAGVDEEQISGGVRAAWDFLNAQSAWYLRLIGDFDEKVGDAVVLQHVRQFLHFLANMSQMRIQ